MNPVAFVKSAKLGIAVLAVPVRPQVANLPAPFHLTSAAGPFPHQAIAPREPMNTRSCPQHQEQPA